VQPRAPQKRRSIPGKPPENVLDNEYGPAAQSAANPAPQVPSRISRLAEYGA